MSRPPIDPRESLRHVARGGIPLRAEQRLAEEAHQRLFTSDLSVAEFVLSREAGCAPIAQVMGSSIYQVGKIADFKGETSEITSISDAHREARRLALARLGREAALVKADAVIGVHLRERMLTMGAQGKGGDDGGEVLEFTAVGTAVRAPWIPHEPGQPVVTDLSGQDLWALWKEGYEPCGFLFDFCRYHVFHVTSESPSVGELSSASEAVEEARRITERRLTAQATQLGAEFVVGSDLTLSMREVPCGFESCELNDLDIDVSWFATGIRRAAKAQPVHRPVPMVLSMMPLGRRRASAIHAEDDTDEVAEAAEEGREAALLAEEGAL